MPPENLPLELAQKLMSEVYLDAWFTACGLFSVPSISLLAVSYWQWLRMVHLLVVPGPASFYSFIFIAGIRFFRKQASSLLEAPVKQISFSCSMLKKNDVFSSSYIDVIYS